MTHTSQPTSLVWILIPCHNGAQWVAQAIESALSQTYRPVEVIVMDDGSTDGSQDIIDGFGSTVQFVSTHRRANATRNHLYHWLRRMGTESRCGRLPATRQTTAASGVR